MYFNSACKLKVIKFAIEEVRIIEVIEFHTSDCKNKLQLEVFFPICIAKNKIIDRFQHWFRVSVLRTLITCLWLLLSISEDAFCVPYGKCLSSIKNFANTL